jgi:zinc D-Ala-D-Ala carboxypeptidase
MSEPTNVEPGDESAGVICSEPDPIYDIPTPPPPVADTSGEELPDTLELPKVRAAYRRELTYIERVSSLVDLDERTRQLRVGASLNTSQATAALRALGWRVRTTGEFKQALHNFQYAWNLGAPLAPDSTLGPLTSAALSVSLSRRGRGLPTASAHFSFTEAACKCGGRYGNCQRIWVNRALFSSLEVLRAKAYPGGLSPASICRCPSWNHGVGGASNSQHMYGNACDVQYAARDVSVASWRLFGGLGRSRSTRLIRHVDRRDQSHNTTGGTLARPTIWDYAV